MNLPAQRPINLSKYTASFGPVFDIPMEACYIGPEAAERLADFARQKGLTSAMLLSDANTRAVGGEALLAALSRAGLGVREKNYDGEPLDASDILGDEVADAAGDAECIVAIGSGTLSDLAKHAGTKLNRPVLLYPTAASMNGYTSAITAVKVRGLKRTVPCQPAAGVFADPAVVATAPARMTAAGVADFLSKASASSDWRAAHMFRGEWFSEDARAYVQGTQDALLEAAPRIGLGDPDAVGVALEALLLSGFAMIIAGSSAPASGGEHLISHYLDMKHALYGTRNDLHGTQVGVATVYCLQLWERLLRIDPEDLDVGALLDAQPSEAQIDAWIEEDWGHRVGAEVREQWRQKSKDRAFLEQELRMFIQHHRRLHDAVCHDFLPSATVEKAILDAGGPVEPEYMLAPVEEYRNAQKRARFIRNRFTVLDLAAELCLA